MSKNLLLLTMFFLAFIQLSAQRYFEFHFPDNVSTCRGCNGFGEEENFIVKVEDANTEFIERALSDLEKPDSLKQYFVLGFLQYAEDDFNYKWSWEFRRDTVMYMNKDGLYADSFGGISSKIENNLDGIINQLGGKCFISKARVLKEIIITNIDKHKTENQIIIYPNPVSKELHCDGIDIASDNSITFYTLDGQFVFRKKIESKTINIQDLKKPSTYIYKIHGEKNTLITFGKINTK